MTTRREITAEEFDRRLEEHRAKKAAHPYGPYAAAVHVFRNEAGDLENQFYSHPSHGLASIWENVTLRRYFVAA